MPAVTNLRDAIAPGAPQLWPAAGNNLVAETRYGDQAAVEAAFAKAARVIELSLEAQRISGVPMEPKASLAAWDSVSGRDTAGRPTITRRCDPWAALFH